MLFDVKRHPQFFLINAVGPMFVTENCLRDPFGFTWRSALEFDVRATECSSTQNPAEAAKVPEAVHFAVVLVLQVLVLLSSLTFFLPLSSDSRGGGERVSYAATLMLTIMATLLFTADKRPQTDVPQEGLTAVQGVTGYSIVFQASQACFRVSWMSARSHHVNAPYRCDKDPEER